MPTIIDRVLQVAAAEVGVHEVGGNNRGPRVEEYIRACGANPGDPWCACFTSWSLLEAGVRGVPPTADTWAVENWAAGKGVLYGQTGLSEVKRGGPARGDFFLLLHYRDRRPRHMGFVAGVAGDIIQTIEGNTGLLSETDGDGVESKRRNWRAWPNMHFVRWAEAPGVAWEAPPKPFRVSYEKPDGSWGTIDCSPDNQAGTTRVALRPLAEALGWRVDASGYAHGLIRLWKPQGNGGDVPA